MTEFYNAPGASADVPVTTFRKNGFYGKIAPGALAPVPPVRASETVPLTPISGRASRPDLGNNAKSLDPLPFGAHLSGQQEGAGVVASVGADSAAVRVKVQTLRAERYFLQSAARSLLLNAGRLAGLQYPANYHRTAKCKHTRHGAAVGVHVAPEYNSAFYSGLVTCGSVWGCPVCTTKIQERRRAEIAQAIDWAYANGYQPVMVTLTFPHYGWQKLKALRSQQKRALELLRSGAPWKRFVERENYQGLIRSLELTHGAKNGWHLHTHELWFLDKNSDASQVKEAVLKQWMSACARAGLLDLANAAQVAAFELHSVDVIANCSTSDYLAKMDDSKHWGTDREMAKATSKAGKKSGRHPFGLLADYASGDRRSGRLFLAYLLAMKGQRQIYWSPGLKKRAGVGELSDETLAGEEREKADLLGLLTDDDWRTVRDAGKRAAVLDAAELGGWPAVEALLQRLTLDEIERLEAQIAALGVP